MINTSNLKDKKLLVPDHCIALKAIVLFAPQKQIKSKK